ncbi:MAG: hypothetical protein ACOH17_14255 [Cellulomonas sp.]
MTTRLEAHDTLRMLDRAAKWKTTWTDDDWKAASRALADALPTTPDGWLTEHATAELRRGRLPATEDLIRGWRTHAADVVAANPIVSRPIGLSPAAERRWEIARRDALLAGQDADAADQAANVAVGLPAHPVSTVTPQEGAAARDRVRVALVGLAARQDAAQAALLARADVTL